MNSQKNTFKSLLILIILGVSFSNAKGNKELELPDAELFSNNENRYADFQQRILYLKCYPNKSLEKNEILCDMDYLSFTPSKLKTRSNKAKHKIHLQKYTRVFKNINNKKWVWNDLSYGACKTHTIITIKPIYHLGYVDSWEYKQDILSVDNERNSGCIKHRKRIGDPIVYTEPKIREFELKDGTGVFY